MYREALRLSRVAGDWRLEVSDNANVDTGTLNAWSIEAVVRQ